MTDSYQPIYDAVRSRISNGDIGAAVERALSNANLSHYAQMAMLAAQQAAMEATRPSVLFRPRLFLDGNAWCALYGDDLQSGVAGFGNSPYLACADFDKNWESKDIVKAINERLDQERKDNGQFGVGA